MGGKQSKIKKGGSIAIDILSNILKESYNIDKPHKQYDNYYYDWILSNNYVTVYYNPINDHVIIAHRGTKELSDWIVNLTYGTRNQIDFENTSRYKESKMIQLVAEEKYGVHNMTTIGWKIFKIFF